MRLRSSPSYPIAALYHICGYTPDLGAEEAETQTLRWRPSMKAQPRELSSSSGTTAVTKAAVKPLLDKKDLWIFICRQSVEKLEGPGLLLLLLKSA